MGTLRHIADLFGPAFLTLFYLSLGLMMILTLMLFGVVVSNHRSTAEVSQCHVDLENSAVDLNEFYPSLDEPIKLPLLRYSYDWNGKGLEDSCAVVLEKCEICDCKENETALLVEARDWNVTCKILPKAALAVDRRNIGDKDNSQDEDQSSPIVLTGLQQMIPMMIQMMIPLIIPVQEILRMEVPMIIQSLPSM